MKKLFGLIVLGIVIAVCAGCTDYSDTSDGKQMKQQEVLLDEATSQVGMPAIKNFRERKILKDILELRDQEGLVTYTYVVNELTGKLLYFGETIGYGIPYATQLTNPEKPLKSYDSDCINSEASTIPQADPNGLFSPESAEGTWVLLKNPDGNDVKLVYIEPRIIVSPFKLPARLLTE